MKTLVLCENIGVGKNRSTPGVSHPPLHFHKLYNISFSLPDQNNIGWRKHTALWTNEVWVGFWGKKQSNGISAISVFYHVCPFPPDIFCWFDVFIIQHWMTIPKFWPKPIPRLFFWYQIFRNRNRNPQKIGKSFETEKFRNRNVNLCSRPPIK